MRANAVYIDHLTPWLIVSRHSMARALAVPMREFQCTMRRVLSHLTPLFAKLARFRPHFPQGRFILSLFTGEYMYEFFNNGKEMPKSDPDAVEDAATDDATASDASTTTSSKGALPDGLTRRNSAAKEAGE